MFRAVFSEIVCDKDELDVWIALWSCRRICLDYKLAVAYACGFLFFLAIGFIFSLQIEYEIGPLCWPYEEPRVEDNYRNIAPGSRFYERFTCFTKKVHYDIFRSRYSMQIARFSCRYHVFESSHTNCLFYGLL